MERLTVPQLLAQAAERFGEAEFLVAGDVSRSFAQTFANARGIAAWLRAERGVAPYDRILLAASNAPATIETWLGALVAGAVPAVINPRLTESEIAYLASDLAPRLAIAEPGTAAFATLANPIALDAVGRASGGVRLAGAEWSEVAGIVYTSGTTSRPKGALVRHAAYVGAGQSMRTWLGLGDDERLWCVLPFFHINAQAYTLMTALANGYPVVVADKFHGSTFWRDAAAARVTAVNLIGAMLAILAQQPPEQFVAGSLRTIYAAPALDPARNRELERRFGVRVLTGFGMSENTFGCIESPTSRDKPKSIGRARQHPAGLVRNDLRIVTPSGDPVADGEIGELRFRSEAITPGYWNAPEITARTIVDGWLRTGDAGYIDADGDVILTGRYKEMIRRRGENIAPAEIEDALMLHPAVRLAAVIGVPSPLTEEDVLACIALNEGRYAGEAELRDWCRARLAPYKVPERIVVRDTLPMTPTMRVAKDRLRSELVADGTI